MLPDEQIKELHQNIDKIIKRGLLDNKEIVCFGYNNSTIETIRYLDSLGYKTSGIVDNGHAGIMSETLQVVKPEEYKFNRNAVILIGSRHFYEMREQLIKLGCKPGQVIRTLEYRLLYHPSIGIRTFFEEASFIKKGYSIYKKLRKKYGNGCIFFISPAKSIGDIYLILMYLKVYIKQEKTENYMLIVRGGAAASLCQKSYTNKFLKMELEEINPLRRFVQFVGEKKSNTYVLNELSNHTNMMKNVIGYGNYNNFSLCYRRTLFSLKENKKIIFENPVIQNRKKIGKYIADGRLVSGKTVLVAPYTNYLRPVPMRFWEKLVQILIENQWKVYTNTSSEQEVPVKGTEGIFLGFDELTAFVDQAGIFIGARSGICDVLSCTTASMYIVYIKHDETQFITADKYFSLKGMGLNNNVKEYVYEDEQEIFLIKQITDDIINKKI